MKIRQARKILRKWWPRLRFKSVSDELEWSRRMRPKVRKASRRLFRFAACCLKRERIQGMKRNLATLAQPRPGTCYHDVIAARKADLTMEQKIEGLLSDRKIEQQALGRLQRSDLPQLDSRPPG